MNYQHFVFDVDGTLINTRKADLKSLQKTVRILKNKHININQLLSILDLPSKDALKQLQIRNIEQGIITWEKNRVKYNHLIKLFNGVTTLIKELIKQGVNLGIITSKSKLEYKNDFSKFRISSFFKKVVCLDDVLFPKPSADPLLIYLKNNHILKKEEVLYIGDSLSDAFCAQNAGIDFALALWGGINYLKSQIIQPIQAKYYIYNPIEILSLF